MIDADLYTPQELIELYPCLKDYGWNATKIGVAFSMGLLKGRIKRRKAYIKLDSFKEFIEFRNSVNEIKIPPMD